MGHWTESCLISRLPISGGEKVLCIEFPEPYVSKLFTIVSVTDLIGHIENVEAIIEHQKEDGGTAIVKHYIFAYWGEYDSYGRCEGREIGDDNHCIFILADFANRIGISQGLAKDLQNLPPKLIVKALDEASYLRRGLPILVGNQDPSLKELKKHVAMAKSVFAAGQRMIDEWPKDFDTDL